MACSTFRSGLVVACESNQLIAQFRMFKHVPHESKDASRRQFGQRFSGPLFFQAAPAKPVGHRFGVFDLLAALGDFHRYDHFY
jgi:hypothetical protein